MDISRRLYQQGLTNFLNVLDAERSLLSSEDALVRSDSAVSTDLVSLYKALGGGWESFEPNAGGVDDQTAAATAIKHAHSCRRAGTAGPATVVCHR